MTDVYVLERRAYLHVLRIRYFLHFNFFLKMELHTVRVHRKGTASVMPYTHFSVNCIYYVTCIVFTLLDFVTPTADCI